MTLPKRPVVTCPKTIPTERPGRHRVLLVDNDEAVRDMMSVTLKRKGFDVVVATNVADALRLITTESFDVLITDLHMPNPADVFAMVICKATLPRCWYTNHEYCRRPSSGRCRAI